MKQKTNILVLLLAALLPGILSAQIFNPYKRDLKRAEKKAIDQLKGGADFVLDPIETTPRNRTSNLSLLAQTNWGKDLLLPATLRQRLVDECKYKVLVKVADTGHPDHTALKQGQLPGTNYTTDAGVSDGNGHSTHVLGIIAGDEIGILDALVDRGLVRHKAVKVLTNAGSGSFDWVAKAYAAERAEDQAAIGRGEYVVYNGSFGGGTGLIANVETELQKSTDAGVVFCFAAGNTGGAGVNYPGNGKYSIACAALDKSLVRSSFSTTGPEVWAAMPGRDILSTYKGNTYASLSGTSMATPFLTAAVAVAYSKWGPKLNNLARVRAYIAWCAKDLDVPGKDNNTGWGLELIQNVLDRDPASTPGLPDPPPPPPPGNPPAGETSISPLYFALPKEYTINWDNASSASASEVGSTFKVGPRTKNKNFAGKQTKVRISIRIQSSGGTKAEFEKVEKAVDKFFQSRGFMLPAKQDESYAAYWAMYFLEMILETGDKIALDVTNVSLSVGSGTLNIPEASLRHWPVK